MKDWATLLGEIVHI